MLDLEPNPHVYPILPTHLQVITSVPDHLWLSFVCTTLSHRISKTRNVTRCGPLVENFYRYRGNAIRSLKEHVGAGGNHRSDVLLAGIISLLLAEVSDSLPNHVRLRKGRALFADVDYSYTQVQQSSSTNWRCHIEGVQRLIRLRGGIRALWTLKGLEPLLHCFV